MSLRSELVRQYGDDSISLSLLQPGLESIEVDGALMAWLPTPKMDVVLGTVGAQASRRAVIRTFLARQRPAMFAYLSERDAFELQDVARDRFWFTSVGIERSLDLCGPAQPWRSEVRAALRKAGKARITLVEAAPQSLPRSIHDGLRELTRRFAARGQLVRELRFVNRPMQYEDDPGRLFLLVRTDVAGVDRVFGYVVLDPFRTPRGLGWLLNLIRFERCAVWGLYLSTVARLAELLRAEGSASLSLGFSPLLRLQTPPGLRRSRLVDAQVELLGRARRRFYDSSHLDRMKGAFSCVESQRIAALPSKWVPGAFASVSRAMGVSVSELLVRRLRGAPANQVTPTEGELSIPFVAGPVPDSAIRCA